MLPTPKGTHVQRFLLKSLDAVQIERQSEGLTM